MLLKIRKSVFETNSSSAHSMVILNNANYNDTPPADVLIFHINGDYHWGWDEMTNWESKLDYLLTYLISNKFNQHDRDIDIEEVNDYLNNSDDSNLILLKIAFKDVGSNLLFDLRMHNIDDLSIDHESFSLSDDLFQKGLDTLKNFLFSSDSTLYKADDNDGAPDNYFEMLVDKSEDSNYTVL